MATTTLDMYPRDCEECDCQHYAWDLISGLLRSQTASHCRCGHVTARHRFRLMTLACGRYNDHARCSDAECKCFCHPDSEGGNRGAGSPTSATA